MGERLGLTTPKPDAVINCQHKVRARLRHRKVAPEATPLFAAVYNADDAPPACPPPWFAKPIVGRLSQGARRVDDTAAFRELSDPSGYPAAWARIAELAAVPRAAASGFLVEELARGAEVTLEGYVYDGRVTVIGITDSIMYAGTNSFERFEYPSMLDEVLSVDNDASGTRPDDPVRACAMCERPVTVEYFGRIMRPAL